MRRRRPTTTRAERRPGGRSGAGRDRLLRLRPGQGVRPARLAADAANTLADALGDFELPASSVYPLMDHTVAYRSGGPRRRRRPAQGGRGPPPRPGAGRQGQRPHPATWSAAGDAATTRPPTTWANPSPASRTAPTGRSRPSPTSPRRRRDTAAFLALACDEIVMQKDARPRRLRATTSRSIPTASRTLRNELQGHGRERLYPPAPGRGHGGPRRPHLEAWSKGRRRRLLTEAGVEGRPQERAARLAEHDGSEAGRRVPQARRRRRPEVRRGRRAWSTTITICVRRKTSNHG